VLLLVALLMAAGLAALIATRRPRTPVASTPAGAAAPADAPADARGAPPPAVPQVELAPVVVPEPAPGGHASGADDFADASEIAARLPERARASDVARAEALVQRHPDQAQLRELLAGVLMALAKDDLGARRFDAARARLERAAILVPGDARPHVGLHNLHAALENWPQAESAIRAALARDAGNVQAQHALAYALFRQDRNREAEDVLRTLLAAHDDA
jgi:tetratricopeptide (TPR) repeat protein